MINNEMIKNYFTPYKYGKPVLTGSGKPDSFDCNAVDSPFVFYHNGKFQMMYIGFDGKGYQTALAQSEDLLNWEFKAVILPKLENGAWNSMNTSGNWLLKESNNLHDLPTLKKLDGKYWMTYHAYPEQGYEAGAASIGLAWCEDDDLLEWHRMDSPILTCDNAQPWDKGGLYKSCLIENDGSYYLFYNAKNTTYDKWMEQTGVAVSKDLMHWERYPENPVIKTTPQSWDSMFCSDPYVVFDRDKWLMFYFGFNGQRAQEGLAVSSDLLHWEKYGEPILTNGAPGEIDELFAHKPSVLYHDGVLYHYYCSSRFYHKGDATCNFGKEFRTISVATSKPITK
ncbi:MAG TPA: hypothetical protein VHO71_05825 [Caproiciproducens sp.]|nr:hypothetical protein [Caproiciproducens sp.]